MPIQTSTPGSSPIHASKETGQTGDKADLGHPSSIGFSIIIPAFNEERLLENSLSRIKESLQVFTSQGHTYELIVCDNNSTDQTAEIARSQGAKVIFEPINQIARARNTGASIASGKYLIFIDSDSYPPLA